MDFFYTDNELKLLKAKDEKMALLISQCGKITREVEQDPFVALVTSIIGQQVSNKAALTIFTKLKGIMFDQQVRPEYIILLSLEEIKACGMSMKKAENIFLLAKAFIEKKLIPEKWHIMQDKEIIQELIQLKGIGQWSAEMFLIFCLQRKNILSYGDFGIKKGLCLLYGLENISKKDFLYYQEKFSPFGSLASFYLWELANGKIFINSNG